MDSNETIHVACCSKDSSKAGAKKLPTASASVSSRENTSNNCDREFFDQESSSRHRQQPVERETRPRSICENYLDSADHGRAKKRLCREETQSLDHSSSDLSHPISLSVSDSVKPCTSSPTLLKSLEPSDAIRPLDPFSFSNTPLELPIHLPPPCCRPRSPLMDQSYTPNNNQHSLESCQPWDANVPTGTMIKDPSLSFSKRSSKSSSPNIIHDSPPLFSPSLSVVVETTCALALESHTLTSSSSLSPAGLIESNELRRHSVLPRSKQKEQRRIVSLARGFSITSLCQIQKGWDVSRNTVCRRAFSQAAHSTDTNELASSNSSVEGKMYLDDFVKIMQIGQGAYGDVWLAQDIKRNRMVALKKLKLNEEREGFPKNAIREISLLRYLHHPNIVGFHGMIYSRPKSDSLKPAIPLLVSLLSKPQYGFGISIPQSDVQGLTTEEGTTLPSSEQYSEGRYRRVGKSSDSKLASSIEFEGGVFPIERHRWTATSQSGVQQLAGSLSSQWSSKSSVWMVFEYLPFDLNGIVEQLRDQEKQLSVPEVRLILRDILLALEFCHSLNVIHRDLKSANLLISSEGRIKLADFGLARHFNAATAPLTNRVITLWYRPPELLLGAEWYTPSVDIWSAGCIFAELVINKAIFGADNEAKVLKSIAECLGPPSASEWPERTALPFWNSVESNPLLSMSSSEPSITSFQAGSVPPVVMSPGTSSSSLASRIGPKGDSLWNKLNDRIGPIGLNLLKSMLRYNPKDRITARDALNHAWFAVEGVISGLPLSKFQRSHCHAFALRKDRERQREVQRLQQQSGTPQAQAGGLTHIRRQAPRILNNVDYLEKARKAIQNRAAAMVASQQINASQGEPQQQQSETLESSSSSSTTTAAAGNITNVRACGRVPEKKLSDRTALLPNKSTGQARCFNDRNNLRAGASSLSACHDTSDIRSRSFLPPVADNRSSTTRPAVGESAKRQQSTFTAATSDKQVFSLPHDILSPQLHRLSRFDDPSQRHATTASSSTSTSSGGVPPSAGPSLPHSSHGRLQQQPQKLPTHVLHPQHRLPQQHQQQEVQPADQLRGLSQRSRTGVSHLSTGSYPSRAQVKVEPSSSFSQSHQFIRTVLPHQANVSAQAPMLHPPDHLPLLLPVGSASSHLPHTSAAGSPYRPSVAEYNGCYPSHQLLPVQHRTSAHFIIDNDNMDIEMEGVEPTSRSVTLVPSKASTVLHPDAPHTPPPPEPGETSSKTSIQRPPKAKTPASPTVAPPVVARPSSPRSPREPPHKIVSHRCNTVHGRTRSRELEESPGHRSEGEVTDTGSSINSSRHPRLSRRKIGQTTNVLEVGNRYPTQQPPPPPGPPPPVGTTKDRGKRSSLQKYDSKEYWNHQSQRQPTVRQVFVQESHQPPSPHSQQYQQQPYYQYYDHYCDDYGSAGGSRNHSYQTFNQAGSRGVEPDYRSSHNGAHRQRDYLRSSNLGGHHYHRNLIGSHSSNGSGGQQRYNSSNNQNNPQFNRNGGTRQKRY